jgi:glycine/D-amino acid oxidase-like deaminating enzyme
MQKRTVAIIGAGRVGGSVGYLLNKAGYVVETVLTRSMDSA